jgi:hypothetical protein
MHAIRRSTLAETAAWALFATVAIPMGGRPIRAAESTASGEPSPPASVVVQQADDGTVMLSGSDAAIRGTMLRWEPQAQKRTLGFWTKVDDAAEWTFAVRSPGTFDVEVLQGCGRGQGGSDMLLTLDPDGDGEANLAFVVEDTGGFQEFRPRSIGRITIDRPGEHRLRLEPTRIAKSAACDIRQIRLLPVAN